MTDGERELHDQAQMDCMNKCSKCGSYTDEDLTEIRIPGYLFSRYQIMHLCPDCVIEYAEAKKDRNP